MSAFQAAKSLPYVDWAIAENKRRGEARQKKKKG